MTRKSLGGVEFVVLHKEDVPVKFRSIDDAVGLLKHLKNDPVQVSGIRSLVAAASSPQASGDGLRQLASLVASGRIRVIRGVTARRNGTPMPDTPGDALSQTAQAPRAAGKNSWIEIHLRDRKGTPIPGERYRITLPDGSIQEGRLDADGHAEYYGINPGTCEVAFPDIPDEKWNLA